MYINNPKRTMCMLDLLNKYAPDFNYNDLYEVVGEWLSTEKKYFFTDDTTLWKRFIEYFCDSFYSRNINFYAWGDMKIRLRKVLRDCEFNARHIYQSSLINLNPLQTYENSIKRSGTDSSNSQTRGSSSRNTTNSSHGSNTSTNEGTTTTEDSNYNLHSDTPSDSVNIDDLFSVAKNYVTDATNSKVNGSGTSSATSSGTNDRTDNSNSSGTTSTLNDSSSSSIMEELAKGWSGSPVELIEAFNNLNLDVCKFYCEQIENAGLFSAILY